MTEAATAQAGTLETAKDAGGGPAGAVSRWLLELELAHKEEKSWRESADDATCRYRDENKKNGKRYAEKSRFNILYSNVETIRPALYNQTPKPDVRRRFRDADPIGKNVSEIVERSLSFTMDAYDFDRTMKQAVQDLCVVGRGVDRIRYKPSFTKEKDEKGEEYDSLAYEAVCCEHVQWTDFRRGPGRTWEEVRWIAFRHLLTREEAVKELGANANDAELDYSPEGLEKDDKSALLDTFKRMTVWEIWTKDGKEVLWIAPSLKERPVKTEPDPLKLEHFFPIPRPLYAIESTDSLIPIEPYRFYKDQADELDNLTRRISQIIKACQAKGVYDATIQEMANLMDSPETMLIPAENVLNLAAGGGLEKAVWVWPIDKIAAVLVYLYQQREAIKTTIYEITGIADIMRGSTNAQETLGAQQLKAQFGTMRIDDMRREVQRYARDLVRLMAEVISERFDPNTLMLMTGVKLPTPEEKAMAQQQAEAMIQQQQPIPGKLKKVLETPTWEEALTVMREDGARGFRIDIETDSTVTGDVQAEQKAMTELLSGIGAFISQAGPAVAQGYLPLEAAKSMLMSAVRRFKMGREVEDALDTIGGEDGKQLPENPEAGRQKAEAEAKMQESQAKAQEQQMKMQFEQQKGQIELMGMQAKAQAEAAKAETDRMAAEQDRALKAEEHRIRMIELGASHTVALRELAAKERMIAVQEQAKQSDAKRRSEARQ